jgi:prophage regulatory protein
LAKMLSIVILWSAVMTNSKQLLRIADVSHLTSLGKSTINLWVAQGKFPKPIALSPTIKVWKGQQINDWIDSFTSESEPVNDESVLTPS